MLQKMRTSIANKIKSYLAKAGITLLRTSQYNQLQAQRDSLFRQYIAQTAQNTPQKRQGLVGVVFSMDRPIQLYAALESYFKYNKNPAPLHVLYAASSNGYSDAYQQLIQEFSQKLPQDDEGNQSHKNPPAITFIQETNFRNDLINLLDSLTEDNIFFLVDDNIFVSENNMADLMQFNPLEEIVSLRLAPYFTRCYTADVEQLPPSTLQPSQQHKGLFEWRWSDQNAQNEWAYPMAVDMHLFDRNEIATITKLVKFKAPNSYEGALMQFFSAVKNRKGICYKQQWIFNNPCNKVQSENTNLAGDISPEFLLEKWNDNQKIDLKPFHNLKTQAPHEELPLTFVMRYNRPHQRFHCSKYSRFKFKRSVLLLVKNAQN